MMIGAIVARRKVASAFAALNRRDLDGFLRDWGEDVTRTFPGDVRASGTLSGKQRAREWYQDFLQQFPNASFTIENICVERLWDLTGTNVVAVRWDVRLTNRDGRGHENSGVTVIRLKGGKAIRVEDYLSDTGRAFRDAWGETPAVS
jgi:ketosteroid isomerase-like protein